MKRKKSLIDVLGQNVRYVVFNKKDRTQILSSPSDNTIREKIKKEWTLIGWVNKEDTETELLNILTEFYTIKLKETA